MSWLSSSSVGRKVVMSVSGAALVLFLTFHALMNVVAIISPDGYEWICEFLGANWYALVGTAGLAFLVVVHIVYAFILTIQNYKARGKERYAVNARQEGVEWSSKNMLVLGLIVVLGLFLHLFNFWAKMQLVELQGNTPESGVELIKATFGCPVYAVVYLVWLCGLWFHLTHGIWSALHTLGWNNNVWMPRVKCIANIYATLLILLFAAVVVYYLFVGMGCCCGACCAA